MVQITDLNFKYKKDQFLFNGLHLNLTPGHIYGLLGKNGAGKSTLLKHVAGLLFPTTGQCRVLDYDSHNRSVEMLQDIFFIPEEFELPAVTVKQYVSVNAVFYPQFSNERFEQYLHDFELSTDAKLSSLSYGQKKKFIIAFGLATNARVLLLDEPTNGLDIPSKSQFRKTIASALDDDRILVISTHQVRDLDNLIDTVIILEKGQIIFNCDTVTIAERLAFESNIQGITENEVLYTEEISGKRAGIVKNFSGIETRIDLELLFNGVIKNSTAINHQLAK